MDIPQLIETLVVSGGMGTVLMYLNNRANTGTDYALLGYLACAFFLLLLHQVAPLFHPNPARTDNGIYRSCSNQGLWCAFMIPTISVLTSYVGLQGEDEVNITTEVLLMLFTLCLALVLYNPTNNSQIVGALLLLWLKELIKQQDLSNIRLCIFYCILYYSMSTHIPRTFPKSFSFGELTVVLQSTLLITFKFFQLVIIDDSKEIISTLPVEDIMIKIALLSILGVLLSTTLLHICKDIQFKWKFYAAYGISVTVCVVFGLQGKNPVTAVYHYVTSDLPRVYLLAWSISMTTMTIIFTVFKTTVSTVTRKFFHVVVVVIYVPGLWLDPGFLMVSSLLAFCVLFVIETMRYINVPPVGAIIKEKYQIFMDHQDQGPLALTPLYLIAGLSLPLWLSFILLPGNRILGYAGVLSVGIGDAVASVVGSSVGRIKIPGSVKTIEGTLASVISQFITLYSLQYFGSLSISWSIQLVTAIFATTVLEAVTSQIDNLILPLFLYTLLLI